MENTITEGYFGQELKSIKVIKDDLIGNIYVCQHENGSYELYNNDGEGAMSLSSIHIEDFKTKPIDFNERLKEVLK